MLISPTFSNRHTIFEWQEKRREEKERREFPQGSYGHLELWSFSPYL